MDTKQQDNQARSTLATGSQPVLAGGIWASCGHKLADDDGTDGMSFGTITLGDDCDSDGVHRCAFCEQPG